MKRRSILAAGLAPLLPATAPAGRTAIVIGYSVATSRLIEAGMRVTVLQHEQQPVHHGDGITVVNGTSSRLEQPSRSEWNMVYPPTLYDELDWTRARQRLSSPPEHPSIKATVTQIRHASGAFHVKTAQGDAFTADYLFMAAGTVETTSLLVTAKARGWLPRLGAEVGKGFGTNGNFLVMWLNARKDPAPLVDTTNAIAPVAAGPATATGGTPTQLITGVTPERGEIRYDAATGTGRIHWPHPPMQTKAEQASRDLVARLWWQAEGKRGRLLRGLPSYDRARGLGAANTWHPLGGMVMGEATDHHGQSLDYPNLYCLDGSALPGSTCLSDPALTITANAERVMDHFLAGHGSVQRWLAPA